MYDIIPKNNNIICKNTSTTIFIYINDKIKKIA